MTAPRAGRSVVALPAWVALVALGLRWLYQLDNAVVPWPPLHHPGQVWQWTSLHSPVELAFSLVRLMAIAFGWYLLALAGLATMAVVSRASSLLWLAERLTLPSLRPLLLGGLGLTMSFAPLAVAPAGAEPAPRAPPRLVADAAPGPPPARAAPPVMRAEPAPPPTPEPPPPIPALPPAPSSAPAPPSARAPVTSMPAPVVAPPRLEPASPSEPAATTAPPAPPTSEAGRGSSTVVVLQAGDNLWSVTADALAQHWGRPPTPAEVLPYWRAVIAGNRGVLLRPDDPDLVFAGQQVQLPPPPVPPTG